MIIRGAKVWGEKAFVRRDVCTEGIYISSRGGGVVLQRPESYAIPGLIDIHTHGCMGLDYTACSAEDMRAAAEYEASRGVTALCPATLTLPEETLGKACGEIARASSPRGAAIVGINMEGPFISPRRLGAQNPDYVRRPDISLFRALQRASGGMIKLLDIAPELEGAMEVIEEASREAVVSIAHTAAGYEIASEAFARGASHVTHLYNAMPPLHHREPGVVGAAFDAPGVRVELICDGVHVHPSVVRATFRMFGEDRVVMVSDSMMAAGLADGEYELGGMPVRVSDNRAVLVRDGAIAGSVTDLMGCMVTAVKDMGIPLHAAVKCASYNPAAALGISAERGSLEPGRTADIVILDEALNVTDVILRGEHIVVK
ncbi:MAG: N-acetylglucosamine-6-phosphate deacetylase [Synergistaceae bacterium]|jgi:N-acetylglucosamine-6-phosphate deacetylase|nr:N-acetylglucosamine-6-phosphate deacetylase [Synergistaceae bacterium]